MHHANSEVSYILGMDTARHGSALGEIAYREPIGSGRKFQDGHICLEKWVPIWLGIYSRRVPPT